jgi:hypothetical protein
MMTASSGIKAEPFGGVADVGRRNLPNCGGVRLSWAAEHYSYPADIAGLDGR